MRLTMKSWMVKAPLNVTVTQRHPLRALSVCAIISRFIYTFNVYCFELFFSIRTAGTGKSINSNSVTVPGREKRCPQSQGAKKSRSQQNTSSASWPLIEFPIADIRRRTRKYCSNSLLSWRSKEIGTGFQQLPCNNWRAKTGVYKKSKSIYPPLFSAVNIRLFPSFCWVN